MSADKQVTDSTRNGTASSGCPFKGPEPFGEEDSGRFFGRDKELGTLLDRVLPQRLTVLTAESGAGKTSLIQAGLVPALRLMRDTASGDRPGPVIYIQGRGPEREKSAAPLLAHRIRDEIERLTAHCDKPFRAALMGQGTLRTDLELLRAVPLPAEPAEELEPGSIEERDWLLAYLSALCDSVQDHSLVLIIDQVEELLGSGMSGYTRTQGALALQLIGTAFLREERLQLLLSLREEYTARLRPLDDLVGALVRRTYHVSPLTVTAFREGILLTVNTASDQGSRRVSITEDAIDAILDCASGTKVKDRNAPVDALVAQAILKDVYLDQIVHSPNGELLIDVLNLRRYEEQLRKDWKYEARIGESDFGWVAEGAMFRHIDRALKAEGGSALEDGLAEGQVMRVAARMGATLASPRGFKRHVTDVQLVLEALREDLRTPPMAGIDHQHIRNRIAALRDAVHQTARESVTLNVPAASASEKIDLLVRDALGAIARLEGGNVLKPHGLDEHKHRVIALQHDGFGPAFDQWGEQFRNRIEDALASRVGCFGLAIPKGADPKAGTYENLIWVACRLDTVRFHKVRFRKCDFSGSWLQNCEFVDCEFDDCELSAVGFKGGLVSGTEFRECRLLSTAFINTAWNSVKIRGGRSGNASGLLVQDRCIWNGAIEFVDANLSSAVMKDILLGEDGSVQLCRCALHYAQLHAFAAPPGAQTPPYQRVEIRNCRLHGALVEDYERLPDSNKRNNTEIADYHIARPPSTTSHVPGSW